MNLFAVKNMVKKEEALMPRKGENIYKRKDGRWEGRYIKKREEGKVHYGSVYARNYRDVRKKLDDVKKNLNQKTHIVSAGSMEEMGKHWLASMSGTLKASSMNKYSDLLRCYILPEFGESEFSEITNQNIMDFTNSLLSKGGAKRQGLSASTVAEILSTMNSIRMYALKRDFTVAFSPECIHIRREQKGIRVFSEDEQASLLAYLHENMNPTALGILLCFFTGVRIGELCALTWDDFNLAEGNMQVRKTMQRIRVDGSAKRKTEVRIFTPKSICSIRTIPLPEAITGLLNQYYTPGAFLLTGEEERFVEPRTMQNHFKGILSSCQISDANFHAIRHTFATRCIERGFDAKSLSEILGHASVSITMNRYVHPTMALKSQNMNRLSGLFTVG